MRTKKGIVTSAKMQGTATVTCHSFVFHPIYKKRFRRSKKFLVDLNGHEVHEGDQVIISECRPISKRKRFKITEIVQQAAQVGELKEDEQLEKAIHREKHAPVVEQKEEGVEKKEEESSTPSES